MADNRLDLLDPKLKQDCHVLGYFDSNILLLMKNAYFPWFIIVPQSNKIEFYQLDAPLQIKILKQINQVSQFINDCYAVDKINIATLGNVVSQLHVHVVGRYHNDICWPGLVWGVEQFKPYNDNDIIKIKKSLKTAFQNEFSIY